MLLLNLLVENFLKTQLLSDSSFSQSLLFYGEDSLGKLTTAKLFAKSILCSNKEFGGCNKCSNCLAIDKGWHPDYKVVELSGDTIKDKDLEFIFDFLIYKPQMAQKKTLIINNAERFSIKTRSALLKVLEEPNPNTLIIFITDHPNKLLKTIKSRLLQIRFIKPKTLELTNYISKNYKVDPTKLDLFLKLSDNRTGDLIKYIENPEALKEKKKNIELFNSLIKNSFSDNSKIIKAIDEEIADETKKEGSSIKKNFLKNIINDWLDFIEITLISEITNTQNPLNDFTKNHFEKFTLEKKIKTFRNTVQLLNYISNYEANKRLMLEAYYLTTLG